MSTAGGSRPGAGEAEFLTATRAAYDTVAAAYADRYADGLSNRPLDRALFGAFAELVRPTGLPVADIGCGPGWVTAYLASMGVDAFGVDLSPTMVAAARSAYPGLRFVEGTMTALDMPDGSLGGIVAPYSIIHVPAWALPGVFAEFRRVLAGGGRLLLVFQIQPADEPDFYGTRAVTEWLDRPIALEFHRHRPERVVELLEVAGFALRAQMVRQPDGGQETVPRMFLLATAVPSSVDTG